MTILANGHVATKVVGDAAFLAHLGVGTVLTLTLSGKLGGTINGLPISGSGTLEYTFRYGAAVWELDSDGLASGPPLPAGPIIYLPAGAAGNAVVQTTGTIDVSGVFDANKDRYTFKLKGRTASIAVGVFSPNVGCTVTDVQDCGATSCDTAFAGNQQCIDNCKTWQVAGLGC